MPAGNFKQKIFSTTVFCGLGCFRLLNPLVIPDRGAALRSAGWQWVDVSRSQGERITGPVKCKASTEEQTSLEKKWEIPGSIGIVGKRAGFNVSVGVVQPREYCFST